MVIKILVSPSGEAGECSCCKYYENDALNIIWESLAQESCCMEFDCPLDFIINDVSEVMKSEMVS